MLGTQNIYLMDNLHVEDTKVIFYNLLHFKTVRYHRRMPIEFSKISIGFHICVCSVLNSNMCGRSNTFPQNNSFWWNQFGHTSHEKMY